MRVQTWDKKIFDVPEENLQGFLEDYNKATNFDPATLSADPNINPERGTNWGGGARAFAQGIPVIGSYADEAEAYVRSLIGDKSYDEYLKNARFLNRHYILIHIYLFSTYNSPFKLYATFYTFKLIY